MFKKLLDQPTLDLLAKGRDGCYPELLLGVLVVEVPVGVVVHLLPRRCSCRGRRRFRVWLLLLLLLFLCLLHDAAADAWP
jgi:hypothetical protein